MATKIRLSRIGRKDVPIFRIVVCDARWKRDGKVLATIGWYRKKPTPEMRIHRELLETWRSKGAIVSDAVNRLLKHDTP